MIDEAKNLLNHNWEEEERLLIQKVIDNLIYYKKFIPNSLKGDVQSILNMANKIKVDYDNLLNLKLTCTCKVEEEIIEEIIEEKTIQEETIETIETEKLYCNHDTMDCECIEIGPTF